MSYKNNWLKSLSESYNTNNRGQVNLSEELASQVALNEQLFDLVVALCEELGIDPQDLWEDVTTDARDAEQGDKIAKIIKRKPSGANEDEILAISQRMNKEKEDRTRVFGVGGRVTGRTPTGKEVYKARKDRSDRLAPITKREQDRRGF